MRSIAAASALFLALTCTAQAAPVRHLVYQFSAYPTARVAPGDIGYVEGPGTGTMTIDVLGAAPDGGTFVTAQEWWWNAVRPDQQRSCEVYAGGALTCREVPRATYAQEVILPLLSPGFFSADRSWQRNYDITYTANFYVWAATMNLSVVGSKNGGRIVAIATKGVFRPIGGSINRTIETGSIAYDRAAGVPVSIHDVRTPTSMRGIYGSRSFDFELVSDSAARK